jgi:hypothetical protein
MSARRLAGIFNLYIRCTGADSHLYGITSGFAITRALSVSGRSLGI